MFVLKSSTSRYVSSVNSGNGTLPLTDSLDRAHVFGSISELIRALRQAPAVEPDIQNTLEIRRVDEIRRVTDGGVVS